MSQDRVKFYLIYICCSAQTLQTTLVNTSIGFLPLGFILAEQ